MKITQVEALPILNKLPEPFGFSQGWYQKRETVVCRIITDEGIEGFGECFGPIVGQAELLEGFFGKLLQGADPMQVEDLWQKMYLAARRAFQTFIPMSVIGAIDMALWDIRGKALGVPVCVLLGGPTCNTVTPYVTGHYFRPTSVQETIEKVKEEAAQHIAQGFRALKLKVGLGILGGDIRDDLRLVASVREEVGPEPILMVDANYAYSLHEAIAVGRYLQDQDVLWFEEPIDPFDFEGYRILSQKLNLMLATGECFADLRHFLHIANERSAAVLQPDISACGGITQAKKVADLAIATNLWFVPHVWGCGIGMAAALQVIGSYPKASMLEFDQSPFPIRDKIVQMTIKWESGRVVIPTEPGLGVGIDINWLREHRKSL